MLDTSWNATNLVETVYIVSASSESLRPRIAKYKITTQLIGDMLKNRPKKKPFVEIY